MDNNGLLRRTLVAWFSHNVQPSATHALFAHHHGGAGGAVRARNAAGPGKEIAERDTQAGRPASWHVRWLS
jgi:hypothetical protein